MLKWPRLRMRRGASFLPILGELAGSVGDNVFSHNKGGAYVRRRSIPTNPTTVKQTAARSALASLSARWQDLTADQRQEWTEWAEYHPFTNRLGQAQILTGQQAYIACNARLQQAGGTVVDSCPTTNTPSDLDTVSVAAVAATGVFTLTFTGTVPTGGRILVWATLAAGDGRNPNRRAARLIGYTDEDPTTGETITSPYASQAAQASNVWVQVMDANGQVSAGLRTRVVYS